MGADDSASRKRSCATVTDERASSICERAERQRVSVPAVRQLHPPCVRGVRAIVSETSNAPGH